MLLNHLRHRFNAITQDNQDSMITILSLDQVGRVFILVVSVFGRSTVRHTKCHRVVRRHRIARNLTRARTTNIQTSKLIRLLYRRMFRRSLLQANRSNNIGLRSTRNINLRMLLMRGTTLRLFTNNSLSKVSNTHGHNITGRIVQTNQLLSPHRVRIIRLISPISNNKGVPRLINIRNRTRIKTSNLANLKRTTRVIVSVLTSLGLGLLRTLSLNLLLNRNRRLLVQMTRPAKDN